VISFVLEHIIYRFGIPQTLTTDQGAAFISHQFKEFADSLKIKLLNSSPYYAQANGQTKASNKTLTGLIKKKIDEKPRRWHEVLNEALWAYRVSELVYGQEAVLPVEINLQACTVMYQDQLTTEEYKDHMMDGIDDVQESHFNALKEIEGEAASSKGV
jgi:hypothetical protein